jgi:hypothetical protein
MKRSIAFLLLVGTIAVFAAGTQIIGPVQTSRFSREALTNETRLQWLAKLGIDPSGTNFNVEATNVQSGTVLNPVDLVNATNIPWLALQLDARQTVTNAALKAAKDATNSLNAQSLIGFLPAIPGSLLTFDDEVYGSGWNGDVTAPTKNAVYDKVESLALEGGTEYVGSGQGTTVRTNAPSTYIVDVTGTLTNSTTGNAATATAATNVNYGGTVTTSNVLAKIATAERTNSSAFLGYGGLQLSSIVYGQAASGNYNYRGGLEIMPNGWDGTPMSYANTATHPAAFFRVYTNWGGGVSQPVILHIGSVGSMRLEPNFGEPVFGTSYMTIGNEDGNESVKINYVTRSITNGVDGPGYSKPLGFDLTGIIGGSTKGATPGIQGFWGGTNSGPSFLSGIYAGELRFLSRIPTPDLDYPTYGRTYPTDTIETGRMRTNGWQFYGPVDLQQSSPSFATTNIALDFQIASAQTIDLTLTTTNRLYTTNVNAYSGATNFQARTFRIRSGVFSRPLRWPNWTFVSELGPVIPSTLLPAQTVLYLKLDAWGDGETNVVCQFKTGTDATFAYDSDAQAFFTAASISDATQKGAVNYLVVALKAANLWTNMVGLYPMVGGSSGTHAVNLKQPGTYNLTFGGTVTHNSSGITGNGTTGYADTGININSVFGERSKTNMHIAFYNSAVANPGDGSFFGVYSATAGVGSFTLYKNGTSLDRYGPNSVAGPNSIDTLGTEFRGFSAMARTKNGDQFATATRLGVSTTSLTADCVNTRNVYLLADNQAASAGDYSNVNSSFASVGWGLTSAELTTLQGIVENYESILSRNAP